MEHVHADYIDQARERYARRFNGETIRRKAREAARPASGPVAPIETSHAKPRPGLKRSRTAAASKVASRVAAHDELVVPLIREYRSMNMGFAAIADVLNLGELAPPRGGFWSRMQVARICRRHHIERSAKP